MIKCPYCGRKLLEDERYCYFCEQYVGKVLDKAQSSQVPKKSILKKRPEFIAYCVKCNKKVTVKNPQIYTMKSKREAVKGTCPFCGRKVFKIIGMKNKRKS